MKISQLDLFAWYAGKPGRVIIMLVLKEAVPHADLTASGGSGNAEEKNKSWKQEKKDMFLELDTA